MKEKGKNWGVGQKEEGSKKKKKDQSNQGSQGTILGN